MYSEPSEAVRSSFIGTYELLGAPKRDSVSSKNVGRPLPAPPSTGDSTASDSEEEEEEEEDSEDETEQNAEVRDANYYKPVKSGSKVGGEKRRNSGSRQKVSALQLRTIVFSRPHSFSSWLICSSLCLLTFACVCLFVFLFVCFLILSATIRPFAH